MNDLHTDENFMREALIEAKRARNCGEVPVGAVLVRDNEIIARGYNRSIGTHDPSAHAEIQCLRQAGSFLQNYRFVGTTLYVTLEPCPMCAGALVHARVARVVFGTRDFRFGALVSHWNIGADKNTNHRLDITEGVCANECAGILRAFFKEKRNI